MRDPVAPPAKSTVRVGPRERAVGAADVRDGDGEIEQGGPGEHRVERIARCSAPASAGARPGADRARRAHPPALGRKLRPARQSTDWFAAPTGSSADPRLRVARPAPSW